MASIARPMHIEWLASELATNEPEQVAKLLEALEQARRPLLRHQQEVEGGYSWGALDILAGGLLDMSIALSGEGPRALSRPDAGQCRSAARRYPGRGAPLPAHRICSLRSGDGDSPSLPGICSEESGRSLRRRHAA